jgi:outer membrane protein OmpA-like peptidoglycan-associated protein
MDGFSLWLVTTLFLSWLNSKPVAAPPPPPQHPPTKDTIILLPEADGKQTGIVIKTGTQEVAVTEPYQGAELTGGSIQGKAFSAAEVGKLFPEVMQALPEKPSVFILRFEEKGTRLTSESTAMLEQIQQDVSRRVAPEIVISGHTDRVGSEEANLRLSQSRAEAIRDLLVFKGVHFDIIQVFGLGESEPEVATEDGVAEPRNRRVEIRVR